MFFRARSISGPWRGGRRDLASWYQRRQADAQDLATPFRLHEQVLDLRFCKSCEQLRKGLVHARGWKDARPSKVRSQHVVLRRELLIPVSTPRHAMKRRDAV